MPLDALMSVVTVGWLVLAVALVFGVVRASRRISSAVRAAPTRLALDRRSLRLRAVIAPPGSLREVIQLRASLQDNLTHTERVLTEHPRPARVLSELLEELRASAEDLHRDLRVAQYEPAENYRREVLAHLSKRVAQFNHNALSLRRSGMELNGDPSLQQIRDQELRDRIDGLAAAIEDLKINQSAPG